MISNSSLVASRNPDVTSLAERIPKNLSCGKAALWPCCLASRTPTTGWTRFPESIPTIFITSSISCGKRLSGGSAGTLVVIEGRICLHWNSLGCLTSEFYNGRKKTARPLDPAGHGSAIVGPGRWRRSLVESARPARPTWLDGHQDPVQVAGTDAANGRP